MCNRLYIMTALDDIAFLARSQNRVEILAMLSAGPHTRAELQEATDISRPTVGRVVTELQARSLATQTGQEYTTSPLGEFLAAEFQSLLEGAETMRKLRGVIKWLPTDEFDFTLDCFADATITTPRPGDPTAPIRRAATMIREADHIQFLCTAFAPTMYDAIWQRTVHDDQIAIGVMTNELIDAIHAESQTVTVIHEIIASGKAKLYRYDGQCSYDMAIFDETLVGLLVLDDDGYVRAVIDTENEAVRAWVASTIDAHQREAHLLEPDTFTA